MKKLKAWVISQRILWAVLLVASIVIPIVIFFSIQPDPPKATDVADVLNYDATQDKSSCLIQITFDKEVTEGDITVAFYNERGETLAIETKRFSMLDNTLSALFDIDGKVVSYDILDTSQIKSVDNAFPAISLLIWKIASPIIAILLLLFIRSLLLSCKVYYNGDDTIIVYAGYFYNYISINGEKYDEHNTFVTYVPIKMSCNFNGMHLDATISLFRRIALKIDEKLRRPSDWT